MTGAEERKAKVHKLQASVEDFTNYVVHGLVGIKGRSAADVTAFILKDWIGDHQDELARYGIDVASWLKESRQ
jgi:hypothetical protein